MISDAKLQKQRKINPYYILNEMVYYFVSILIIINLNFYLLSVTLTTNMSLDLGSFLATK